MRKAKGVPFPDFLSSWFGSDELFIEAVKLETDQIKRIHQASIISTLDTVYWRICSCLQASLRLSLAI